MNQLTNGELFAGISGFGLGFEWSGIKTTWRVEIDRHCQELLKRSYPDDLLLSDVRECGKHNLPRVDIISFGSPCQDLSVAGKRKGMEGSRSGLFFEAIRIISELKPTFAVWENVPGVFSSNSGRDFAAVLSAFRECGARDIAWRVLDARYFGVAQRRRRVFLVADFTEERAAEILFESEGVSRDSKKSKETGQITPPLTATGVGAGRTGNERNEIDFCIPIDVRNLRDNGDVIGTLQAKKSGGYSLNYQNPVAVARCDTAREGQHHDETQETLIVFDWQAGGGGSDKSFRGKSRSYIVRKGEYAQMRASAVDAIAYKIRGGKDGGGKGFLGSEQTAFTLTGSNDQYLGVRRLTPVECERLQSFPDGWTEGFADSVRYRMLGNAVCVNVADWIGRRIMQAES